MSDFSEWIHHQELLTFEAEKVTEKAGLRAKSIINSREPPILRIALDGTYLDFRIKEIKTSEVKTIWVAKVSDVKPSINWLIHSKKEGDWLYILSELILKKGERKSSDFTRNTEYYVVDRMICKDFKRLLKSIKHKEELSQQKAITQWFSQS